MVMPRMASECSGTCNNDSLPNKPAKISPQRLSGLVRLGKYLNSIELGVWVDKLIPRGTNWFVQLKDVRGFRRVALSNVLVVGRSRKDAVIQSPLKGEGIFLFQVYACGTRRRGDADRRADGQENHDFSRHGRTCVLADWTSALHTPSPACTQTIIRDIAAVGPRPATPWARAATPRASGPTELRIACEGWPVSPEKLCPIDV